MSAPKHDPDAEDLDAITLLNGRIDRSTRCSDLPDPKNPESPDRRQSAQKTPAKEMPRDKAGNRKYPGPGAETRQKPLRQYRTGIYR